MNSDVRDILELENLTSSSTAKSGKHERKRFKRLHEPVKRPQGVNREVWGLIRKDDMDMNSCAPLIPIQDEQPKYKQPKAKLRHGVRKWKWTQFKNPARTDNAVFYHWRYANDDNHNNNSEYQFAKYNKKIHIMDYTDNEYNQYLDDEHWSREETDHLFDLCKTYDLRFYIVHDRWNNGLCDTYKPRTIDELKDRYYKVAGILQQQKTAINNNQKHANGANDVADVATDVFVFDMEHEQKRREQLNKLLSRTIEQIKEEEYLIEELKKIEIRKRERDRKSQNLTQLLNVKDATTTTFNSRQATQTTPTTPTPTTAMTNKSSQKSRKNSLNDTATVDLLSNKEPKSMKKSLIFKAVVESAGIKFPDGKTAGTSLRSYKMKLPPSVGLKKTKAIEQLLDKLQIDHRPIATESICEQFNDLRSDIVLLYDLNQAIFNYEFELQSLKHRYEAIFPGKMASDIITLHDMTTPFQNQTLSAFQALIDTPQKQRMSDSFDVAVTTPTTPLERRRKAALNQTNILKKLRGRGMSLSST